MDMTNKYIITSRRATVQLRAQIERFLSYEVSGVRTMMRPVDPIRFGSKGAFALDMSGKFVSVQEEGSLGYRVAIYRDRLQESPLCTLRPSWDADGVVIEYGSAAVSASVVVERRGLRRTHLLTEDE